MTDRVTIYCVGDEVTPHERVPIAHYRRPWSIGNELHETWGDFRSWTEGGRTFVVPEFLRWVTDDDEQSAADDLSLVKLRRLYRYRCNTCLYDEQRHTYNHAVDVKMTHSRALDLIAAQRITQIPVQAFVRIWKKIMAQ